MSPGTIPSRATLLRLGLASRVSRRILAWALAVGAVGTLAVSWWEAERAYEEQTARLGTTLQGLAEFAAPNLAVAPNPSTVPRSTPSSTPSPGWRT